ncbi:MAG: FAD-dependent oxidoreductase, partial [Gemmataceae bacterium]|nr:FAD-dependent oxidoreductase [Gemmataceae bacterium]
LEMASEAKVRLLMHAFVADPILEDGRVRGVAFESKAGRFAIRAEAAGTDGGEAQEISTIHSFLVLFW